ncbi:unnamed protein product [Rhizophagus irregularis]|nr:unnamed protein product [Rhizophagus irregularis]CAB4403648.1 unnamed protein product [Rhizophagus irregularis]
MSGFNYLTLGSLLLFLDHLSDHLATTISQTDVSWIKNIAKDMEKKFQSVLDKLYNTNVYLALMLDPRYKLYKLQIIPENINIEMTKQVLVDEFNNYQILEQSFNNDEIDDNSLMEDKRK